MHQRKFTKRLLEINWYWNGLKFAPKNQLQSSILFCGFSFGTLKIQKIREIVIWQYPCVCILIYQTIVYCLHILDEAVSLYNSQTTRRQNIAATQLYRFQALLDDPEYLQYPVSCCDIYYDNSNWQTDHFPQINLSLISIWFQVTCAP